MGTLEQEDIVSQTADVRDVDVVTTPKNPLFYPVAHELSLVERVLRKELRSEAPFVDSLVRHGCLMGGKRLRPALLLLAGQAVGALTDQHAVLGAVVEMIHTATLVHDDVLDEATMRRHEPSVNARWDNQSSVLLGDFLFTHAFYLASTLDDTYACRTIGRATNIVCEGELRQVGHCGNFLMDEAEYMSIIDAKTAELCACSCRLGAHYARAEAPVVERLAKYGRALGIAFQLVDDLLDLQGDEAITGKSLGTDLEKRKPTLPLIYSLQCATASERRQLVDCIEGGNNHQAVRAKLNVWFQRFGAYDYARQRAADFVAQARDEIETLPESPAKAVLYQLTEFVVVRAH